ncbi:hypothetical protein L1887_11096 [Cichorium endivia]|nr:hypothetical protein L1887_11096 [Cichorium endivia]
MLDNTILIDSWIGFGFGRCILHLNKPTSFCIFKTAPSFTLPIHRGAVTRLDLHFHLSPYPNTHKSLNSDGDSVCLALCSGCLIGTLTRILGF